MGGSGRAFVRYYGLTNATTGGATAFENAVNAGTDATRRFDANGTLGFATAAQQVAILSGVLSGAQPLTKSGPGTLVLSGTNTYTGATTVSSGTLSVAETGNLGDAAAGLVFDGGTLRITGAALDDLGNLGHPVSFTADKTVGVDVEASSHTVTVSQALSHGTGGVLKLGAGTLALTNANNYSGTTTVGAGKLITTTDSTGGGSYAVSNTAWLVIDLKAVDAQLSAGSAFTLGNSTLEFTGSLTSETVAASTTDALAVQGRVNVHVPADLLTLAELREYPLIDYTTRSGTGDFTLVTTPGAGIAASIEDTGSNIVLRVNSSEPLVWNGDLSAIWDSLVANWKQKSSGTPGRRFGRGASAEFNDTLTANSNVTLTASLQPVLVHFTNAATAYSLSGTGRISGVATLLKDGSNVVTILTTNDYTGATVISGGVINVRQLAGGGVNSALGKASADATNLVLAGGTLRYEGPAAALDRLFSLGARGGALDASGSGALSLNNSGAMGFHEEAGARTLTLTGTNTLNNRVDAILGDNGGATAVAKSGGGTWWLGGTNTYSGLTTVGAGVLDLLNNAALGSVAGGTVVSNGATLQLEGPLTVGAEPLTLAGDGVGGGGALRSGTGSNTFAGLIALAGSARIQSAEVGRTLTLSHTGIITGSTHHLTVGGAGHTTLHSGIGTGTGGLTKEGAGGLTLLGSSSYSGTTTVVGGSLVVEGALSSAGVLLVRSNALLTGTGTVGAVTVQEGGRLAPGGSTGTLRTERLQLDYGSELVYELANSQSNDLIRVAAAGGLALGGGSITLHTAGTTNRFDASGRYNLISYSNSYSGLLSNLTVSNKASSKEYLFGAHDSNITLTIRTTIGWDGSGEDLAPDDLRWTLNTNWADGYVPTSYDVFTFGAATKGHFNTNDMAPNTVLGGLIFLDDAIAPYVLAPLDPSRMLNLAGGITNFSPVTHIINIPLMLQDGDQVIGTISNSLILNGVIGEYGGSRGLVKVGRHTLILTAGNVYSGPTRVTEGTLRVDNGAGSATGSGPLEVRDGGTLAGTGRVSNLSVEPGGILSPGASGAATLTAGDTTWNSNGVYRWEINDFNGAHGSDRGRDHMACTGTLTIAATAANTFTVQVTSLTYGNASGMASNFALLAGFTQVIASAAGISGFSPGKFTVATTNFHNPYAGAWSLAQVDVTNLALVYSPQITNTVATTNGVADPSFAARLTWSMPPNRNIQGNPSSPWRSYAVFYSYDGSEPTTNSPVLTWTNGPSDLGTIATTSLILSNLSFDTEIRLAIAGVDAATNIGPLSVVVTQRTENFVVTQGLVSAQSGVIVRWAQRAGLPYDVLYQDTAGWSDSLTNAWQLLAMVTDSFPEDTGSVARTPPSQLGGSTMRFYRVTRQHHWLTNRVLRTASREIFVARNLRLLPGQNWYSLPASPDDSTVAGAFGTNRLPAGDLNHAAKISWYSGGTADGQPVKTAYLSSAGHWIYSLGGHGNADGDPVPLSEGFLLELPGATPRNLVLLGRLTTNDQAATAYGGNRYNLMSYTVPARLRVRDLGLQAMGFRGAAVNSIFTKPDELRVLNNATGNGSYTSPRLRVWLKITATETNYYHVSGGSANNAILEPDEVLIWWSRGESDQPWTVSPGRFYRAATPQMTP